MPDAKTILIIATIGMVIWTADKTVHGVKKLDRKVCHAITFGHKCKPKPPNDAPVSFGYDPQ